MAAPLTEAEKQNKVRQVMKEFKRGTLRTPTGLQVKNKKQALAIAYRKIRAGKPSRSK